jgi:hypothetical protein
MLREGTVDVYVKVCVLAAGGVAGLEIECEALRIGAEGETDACRCKGFLVEVLRAGLQIGFGLCLGEAVEVEASVVLGNGTAPRAIS